MAIDPNGSKALSVRQEEYIAMRYNGTRSASSGGAETDEGDVRNVDTLIECKVRGTPGKPAKSITITSDIMEKIQDEAFSQGLGWAVACRLYTDSPIAGRKGYIDVILRPIGDDLDRYR